VQRTAERQKNRRRPHAHGNHRRHKIPRTHLLLAPLRPQT
jgi:hypothetical protein